MADFLSNYDLTLNIDGVDRGLMLYIDPQTGQRHMGEGFAPLMTPQSRITEFSYEHIPPEIDVPTAFEDWSLGAGMVEFTKADSFNGFSSVVTNAPRAYNYSINLDLSWPNRIFMSPKRQTDTANFNSTGAAYQFWYSGYFGFWCMAGTGLYKWDLSSNTWILKDTATGNYTSMAELNGVLYASISGAAYHYTTDFINGSIWTTGTLAGNLTGTIAGLFVTRNSALWAMAGESLYSTTNGQNGGVAWSTATPIGSSVEHTASMIVANSDIWIFKREAIYNFDGTTVSQIYSPKYIVNTNGTFAYSHVDGNIYVVYEDSVLGLDPFNTTTTPLRVVYPVPPDDVNPISQDSPELKGTIGQITGNIDGLYFPVNLGAPTIGGPTNYSLYGPAFVIKCEPTTGAIHTIAFLPFNDIIGNSINSSACAVVGPGVQHASNPCLAVGSPGTTRGAAHYILPRSNRRPDNDSNYQFHSVVESFGGEADFGYVYGPWCAYGARAFKKFLNRGTVLALNVSAGQLASLSYEVDDSGVLTDVVDASVVGSNEANINSTVEFNRVRYYLQMNAESAVGSPTVLAMTLHATLNPPRRRTWKPIIELKTNGLLVDGSTDPQDPHVLREIIFGAITKRIELKDRHADNHTVRLLDVQEISVVPTSEGSEERDRQVYQLNIAEVTASVPNLLPGRYAEDVYAEGKAYS